MMNIRCKKAWFGKYKFTVQVDNLSNEHPNPSHAKFKIMKKWINEHAPYITLKSNCNGFQDLVFDEYVFKLSIDEAVPFKIEFMT